MHMHMAEGLLCCAAPEPDCPQCTQLVASGAFSDGNASESSEGGEGCTEDVLEFGVEAITPPRPPGRHWPLEASIGCSSFTCRHGLGGVVAVSSGSSVPWANLKGPSSWSDAPLPAIKAEVFDPALKGVAVPQSARTTPVAKKNPCSKFGFLTVSFSGDRYAADCNDALDVEMARALASLGNEAASTLSLRRLATGRYEIDGRFVSLRRNVNGSVFARESTLGSDLPPQASGGEGDEAPLPELLWQLASIAERLQSPKTGRTLTFPEAHACGGDRFRSMELACKQAQLRAQAADEWRRGGPVSPLPAEVTPPRLQPVEVPSPFGRFRIPAVRL